MTWHNCTPNLEQLLPGSEGLQHALLHHITASMAQWPADLSHQKSMCHTSFFANYHIATTNTVLQFLNEAALAVPASITCAALSMMSALMPAM